jgi:hypothetical protein
VCPTFSGGEEEYAECVFPRSQKLMLDFFGEVKKDGGKYVNPVFEVVKSVEENGGAGAGAGGTGRDLTIKNVDRDGIAAKWRYDCADCGEGQGD